MGSVTCNLRKLRVLSGPRGATTVSIRKSRNPFGRGYPLAVVDCGECGARYKSSLFYMPDSVLESFGKVTRDLECPECGNTEKISYMKTPLRLERGGAWRTGAYELHDYVSTMTVSYRKSASC